LRKETITFVMSVRCLSVSMEQLDSHWKDFYEIWFLSVFRKSVEKNHVSLRSDKNNGYFTWRRMHICDNILLSYFLEWEMLQTRVVEKIKTHILWSIFFFRKSCRLYHNVEKYGRAKQSTDDNIIRRMRFACWITKATDTHSEYVILIAFLQQQWLHERLDVTLYVHCQTCFFNTRFNVSSL
jgi:hypothetical protein